MFRSTIREALAVVLAGLTIVLLMIVFVGLLWWRNDNSNVGRIRRGLEHVETETERRDKEIEELTRVRGKR